MVNVELTKATERTEETVSVYDVNYPSNTDAVRDGDLESSSSSKGAATSTETSSSRGKPATSLS